MMTVDELRADWATLQGIIKREKRWRRIVFAGRPAMQAEKLAEMDEMLAILTRWKEQLKGNSISPNDSQFHQPNLLEVPKKGGY